MQPWDARCRHRCRASIADPRDASRKISGVDPDLRIVGIQVYSKFTRSSDCAPSTAPCARALDSSILQALERVRALELSRLSTGQGVRIAAVNLVSAAEKNLPPATQVTLLQGRSPS